MKDFPEETGITVGDFIDKLDNTNVLGHGQIQTIWDHIMNEEDLSEQARRIHDIADLGGNQKNINALFAFFRNLFSYKIKLSGQIPKTAVDRGSYLTSTQIGLIIKNSQNTLPEEVSEAIKDLVELEICNPLQKKQAHHQKEKAGSHIRIDGTRKNAGGKKAKLRQKNRRPRNRGTKQF